MPTSLGRPSWRLAPFCHVSQHHHVPKCKQGRDLCRLNEACKQRPITTEYQCTRPEDPATPQPGQQSPHLRNQRRRFHRAQGDCRKILQPPIFLDQPRCTFIRSVARLGQILGNTGAVSRRNGQAIAFCPKWHRSRSVVQRGGPLIGIFRSHLIRSHSLSQTPCPQKPSSLQARAPALMTAPSRQGALP